MPVPTFELTIQSTTEPTRFRVVAEHRVPGELPVRAEHAFELDLRESDEGGVLDRLAALTEQPAPYGQLLGERVLDGAVRDLFVRARASGSRVLLAVEARALQSLRWERLRGPFDGEWQFLAINQGSPFSLYLPSTSHRRFPPFGRHELRALVVVATPGRRDGYRLPRFAEAAAVGVVRAGLGDVPMTVLGHGEHVDGPPSLREILRRLTAERFPLLHLVGHGALVRNRGEPAVFLVDEQDRNVPVLASTLVERLRELAPPHGLPHLVVLSVCHGARPGAEAALGGLGQRLVREVGIPAVVAMTDRVRQRTALTLTEAMYGRLREHGEIDRALAEARQAVRDEPDAEVPVLLSRLGGRPLFSVALDRPPSAAELEALGPRLHALFEQRAPVLRDQAQALLRRVAIDPRVLRGEAAQEREQALGELERLCEDALELSLTALAHGTEPPPYELRCPFPGLGAFTAADRPYFRGRDGLVDELLRQLRRRSFVAVLGGSGCGKSSLVMAGALPRLRDADPSLRTAEIRPGARPLAALRGTRRTLGRSGGVLFVDQLEEVFTRCDPPRRQRFLDRLLAAAKVPGRRVIVSMRADFIGDCAEHPGLREELRDLLLVPRMSADELRNAIEEQGQAAGLRYEAGLCERVLEDVADEPGAMPLLQHALRELYERRHGRWLRVEAYEEIGRVRQAITRTAEGVWSELDDDDRERLRTVMLELTEIHDDRSEGAARYLRRRVALPELAAGVDDEAAIRRLVERLASERLLVHGEDPVRGGTVVEVAHEALLRHWERLQGWIAEDRDALRLRRELEDSAEAWRRSEEARSYLEHLHDRGELVQTFLRRGALRPSAAVRAYLAACEAEQRRLEQQEAQRIEELRAARDEAIAQRDRARDATWMAFARTMAALDPTRAVLGLQAVRSERTPGWRQEALDLLQQPIAGAWLEGHDGAVLDACLDPSGRRIASGGADGTARLWDVEGRDEPVVLRGHDGPVTVVAFAPDGERLLTASSDGTARVWDAQGRGEPVVLRGHGRAITAASFDPHGRRVVTASDDHCARVWDAEGIAEPRVLRGHVNRVIAARFAPDGERVVTASTDGTVRWWRIDDDEATMVLRPAGPARGITSMSLDARGRAVLIANGAGLWLWDGDGPDDPFVRLRDDEHEAIAVSFGPNALQAAVATRQGTLEVLRPYTGAIATARLELGTTITTAGLDARGSWGIAGGADGTTRLLPVDGASPPRLLRGHADAVTAARSSADGRRIVTASRDRTLRVWSTAVSEAVVELRGHEARVSWASFDPDGRRVVTASADRSARLWSLDGRGAVRVLEGHANGVTMASFDAMGQRIATASHDHSARVWDPERRTALAVLRGHEDGVFSARFSPDGRRLVTASRDHSARVWSLDGEGPTVVLRHEGIVAWASFSADGRSVITASHDGTARVWPAEGGAPSRVLHGHRGPVLAASFAPDGRRIVTVSSDGTVREWTASGGDGIVVGRASVEDERLWADYGRDGRLAISSARLEIARLWGTDDGEGDLQLRGHAGRVRPPWLGPRRQRAVTVSHDATARVWTVAPGLLRRYLHAASTARVPIADRAQYLGETLDEARAAHEAREPHDDDEPHR